MSSSMALSLTRAQRERIARRLRRCDAKGRRIYTDEDLFRFGLYVLLHTASSSDDGPPPMYEDALEELATRVGFVEGDTPERINELLAAHWAGISAIRNLEAELRDLAREFGAGESKEAHRDLLGGVPRTNGELPAGPRVRSGPLARLCVAQLVPPKVGSETSR